MVSNSLNSIGNEIPNLSGAQEAGNYGRRDTIIRRNLGQNVGAVTLRWRGSGGGHSEPSRAPLRVGDKSLAKGGS